MVNTIEIDLGALRHNFQQVRRFIKPTTKIMAIVKSDAYGHGMIHVSKELSKLGVDFLGVGDVREGLVLRKAKISTPIVVLLGISEEECSTVIQNNLIPAVYRLDIAHRLSQEALKKGRIQKIHLKIDTGMGRLGIPAHEVTSFLSKIRSLKSLEVEALFSHLACAHESDEEYTRFQLERFKKAIVEAKKMGFSLLYNHIANSAAIIDYKEAHFDLVRPGIMLYGSYPSSQFKEKVSLKPVMTFKSKIIQIKRLPPNSGISYGRTYITPGEALIATIPVGYDNGYMKSLSNKGEVLIGGRRAKIVGVVCMNLLMAEVTNIPNVQVNDEVVLLGSQMKDVITAEEIAERAGTISYEIYCALGNRNQRIYKEEP
ncbi:MAG TPA: alanine racemase [Syntrophaceae bacterium]|nr:alanine racemase [Syntrophaceae bacterium]